MSLAPVACGPRESYSVGPAQVVVRTGSPSTAAFRSGHVAYPAPNASRKIPAHAADFQFRPRHASNAARAAIANGIGSQTDRVSVAPAAASPPQTAGSHRGEGRARSSSGRTHSATPHRLSVASRANSVSLSSITPNAIASGFTAAIHAATTPTRSPPTARPSRPVAQTARVAVSATDSRATDHRPNPCHRGTPSSRSSFTGPVSASGKPGDRIARRGNGTSSVDRVSPAGGQIRGEFDVPARVAGDDEIAVAELQRGFHAEPRRQPQDERGRHRRRERVPAGEIAHAISPAAGSGTGANGSISSSFSIRRRWRPPSKSSLSQTFHDF